MDFKKKIKQLDLFAKIKDSKIVKTLWKNISKQFFGLDNINSIRKIVSLTSIILSFASGYTTYHGLLFYVDNNYVLAFLVTISIQGLLLVSAWQLRSKIFRRGKKIVFLISLILTMLISVSFSYSCLLEKLYPLKDRKKDEIERVKIVSANVIKPLTDRLYEGHNKQIRLLNIELTNFHKEIVNLINPLRKGLYKNLNSKIIEESSAKENYRLNEIQLKIQLSRSTGEVENSLKSSGIRQSNAVGAMIAAQNKYDEIENAIKTFNTAYENLMKSSSIDALTNYNVELSNLRSIAYNLNDSGENIPQFNVVLPEKLATCVKDASDLESLFKIGTSIIGKKIDDLSLREIREQFIEFLMKVPYSQKGGIVPYISDEKRAVYLKMVEDIGKYGGDEVHHFILAVGLLFVNFNWLAAFALTLAFVIDLMILLCGLVGVKDVIIFSGELEDALNAALEVGPNNVPKNHDSDKVTRIFQILEKSKPNFGDKKKTNPIVLYSSDLEKFYMSKEYAVFTSNELAQISEKDNYMITEKVLERLELILSPNCKSYITDRLKSIMGIEFEEEKFLSALEKLDLLGKERPSSIENWVKEKLGISKKSDPISDPIYSFPKIWLLNFEELKNKIISNEGLAKNQKDELLSIFTNLISKLVEYENDSERLKELILIIAHNPKICISSNLVNWLAVQLRETKDAEGIAGGIEEITQIVCKDNN